MILAAAACSSNYGADNRLLVADLPDSGTRRDARTTGEASTSEPPDAAPPPSCPSVEAPIGDSGARSAVAIHSTRPKIVDGDFADWTGCPAFVLDRSTAASEARSDGGGVAAAATVQVEWDEDALYVAVDVKDPNVQGDPAASCPCNNDSMEIFVGGVAATRTGDYSSRDHHYVVDHSGLSGDYSNVDKPVPFPGATAKATATGYRIEMKIDAAAIGGALRAGQTLYFDAMLNDGLNQARYVIWSMSPHDKCTCTTCACNFSPAYDTLLFAPLSLLP